MASAQSLVKEPDRAQRVMPKGSWWYILPALSSVFLLGGALGGESQVLVAVCLLMLLLAIVSLVRPTILAWACLMVGSVGNLIFLFWSLDNSWHGSPTLGQWILFTVIGLLPAMALWRYRPQSRGVDR